MSQNGQDLMICLILLFANAIVSLIYFVIIRIELKKDRKNKKGDLKSEQSSVLRLIVMLVIPVIGPLYFFFSWVLFKLFFSKPVDLEDVIFSKEKVNFNKKAEEDKERNLVSLEEAVEITEKEDLRALMMNVVSGDIQKFLSSINHALQSEDTETAHYAASVLQDEMNRFRDQVDKNLKKMNDEPENKLIVAEMLIEYMNVILKQRVFVEMEQKEYVGILDNVADIYYNGARERVTVDIYENISMRLLEINDFSNCEKWAERAAKQYPDSLTGYMLRLKLYFKTGRREEFFELLEELKSTSIVIDKETLELIRAIQKA